VVILSVCLCVCVLTTTVSPAKTAEPTVVLFGMWTQVDPGNYTLYAGLDLSREWAVLESEEWPPFCKVFGLLSVIDVKWWISLRWLVRSGDLLEACITQKDTFGRFSTRC